jgi:Cu/Ag efflux protein CusF
MTTTTATMLVSVLGLVATGLFAQPTVSKSNSVTATATIQAIDITSRMLTLRLENGQEDTFSVGPEVRRFNELKVGDTIKVTYYESLVFQVRKPGEKVDPASVDVALNRAKGALPAGTLSVQDKMTVTVKAIDPAVPSVTVTTQDGRTVVRRIENKKNIEGLKVGDQIDITYTRALVSSIERPK